MKRTAIAAVLFEPCVFLAVHAQVKDSAVAVKETEAVVTVTKVDKEARTVTFRGPQAATSARSKCPKESQNLDQVKPGQQYKMKYVEAVAVEIRKGGKPSATEAREVKVAPKGAKPGGVVAQHHADHRRGRCDRLHRPLRGGARAERQRGGAQGRAGCAARPAQRRRPHHRDPHRCARGGDGGAGAAAESAGPERGNRQSALLRV